MSDIVERLRACAFDKDNCPNMKSERKLTVGDALEAAEEIERLRAENEALKKTVREYSRQLALDTGDRRLKGLFGG